MSDRTKLTGQVCVQAAHLQIAMRQHDRDGVITVEERRLEHRLAVLTTVYAAVLKVWQAEWEYRLKAGPFAPLYPALARERREAEALLDEHIPGWRITGKLPEQDMEPEPERPATVLDPPRLVLVHSRQGQAKGKTRPVATRQVHLVTTEVSKANR